MADHIQHRLILPHKGRFADYSRRRAPRNAGTLIANGKPEAYGDGGEMGVNQFTGRPKIGAPGRDISSSSSPVAGSVADSSGSSPLISNPSSAARLHGLCMVDPLEGKAGFAPPPSRTCDVESTQL
jgi:hypothetical protein